MKLSYHIIDPTGNITILVDNPVARRQQPAVAAALLQAEPQAEQVGFLEPPGNGCCIRVHMAGGEFCGNATLSAAALWGKTSRENTVTVGMSGAEKPLTVTLQRRNGDFEGVVDLPLPETVDVRAFCLDERRFALPMVSLPGITHLLLTQRLEKSDAERAVKLWCRQLQAPGLGLMLLDEVSMTLTPLVYIPGADTLYWERSCASGTAAVGAALAVQRGCNVALSLTEPGGVLTVTAELREGRLSRLQLGGRVRLLARKEGEFTV